MKAEASNKCIRYSSSGQRVEKTITRGTKVLRTIRFSEKIRQHGISRNMLDDSQLLGDQVPDKMMASMNMTGLPGDVRSHGQIDRRHVVLINDSRLKLGEPNIL